MLLLGWGWSNRLGLRSLFDDGAKHRCVHKAHEKESLEDSIGELRSLFEQFGSFGGVAHDKAFHLGQNVEELGCREGREGF